MCGTPPTPVATTGTPTAMASPMTTGAVSCIEGSTASVPRAYSPAISARLRLSRKRTCWPSLWPAMKDWQASK